MNRSQFTTKLKRKYGNNMKIESSESKDNITEDSSDNFYSDAEASKMSKQYQEVEYEDSNDSMGASKDASFTEKDFSNSLADNRLRQRGSQTIVKVLNKNIYLQQCLDYIHRLLSRKDKDDFFQFPVTDLIAPGYSSIIKKPMDFSTMKKKIDTFQYANILEYRDDFVLMCENAMTYNRSDTIYHHAGRKLLDSGLKVLNKDKLLSLRRTLPVMKNLTSNDLGFVPEGEAEASYDVQIMIQRKKQAQKQHVVSHTVNHQVAVSKSTIFQKLEVLKPESRETPESILAETQKAAKTAAENLAVKYSNSKLGYLRRDSNGAATFNFISENGGEKDLTVGNLCEALDSGSYSLTSFIEEKKNKAKPMYYLEYGPFSSHAPNYDSSYSNLTKEENDLLMSTYGDETSYQYALSLMEFSKGTGPIFSKYVDVVLNSITNNDHQKYVDAIKSKSTTACNEINKIESITDENRNKKNNNNEQNISEQSTTTIKSNNQYDNNNILSNQQQI